MVTQPLGALHVGEMLSTLFSQECLPDTNRCATWRVGKLLRVSMPQFWPKKVRFIFKTVLRQHKWEASRMGIRGGCQVRPHCPSQTAALNSEEAQRDLRSSSLLAGVIWRQAVYSV